MTNSVTDMFFEDLDNELACPGSTYDTLTPEEVAASLARNLEVADREFAKRMGYIE